jgi:hypothetical protein
MQRIYIPPQTFTGINNTIYVQVMVEDFTSVGAISLELVYDNQILQLEAIEDTQNVITCNYGEYSPGVIRVAWVGNGRNLDNNTSLFQLRFKTLQASVTSIGFTTQTPRLCEIADASAEVLPFTFEDGQITIED